MQQKLEWKRRAEQPGSGGGRALLFLGSCILASVVGDAVRADPVAVYISGHYQGRVASIETIGDLFDGSRDVDTGSGFLLGNDVVLTANHLVPREGNYKSSQILVRIGNLHDAARPATVLARNASADVALLKLDQPDLHVLPACPVPIDDDDSSLSVGATVYVLGFPLDRDQAIAPGLISSEIDTRGRWMTNALLNVGNSGGPVFGPNGNLIGLVTGGIVKWTNYANETSDTQGVNFFIPFKALKQAAIYGNLYVGSSCGGTPNLLPGWLVALENSASSRATILIANASNLAHTLGFSSIPTSPSWQPRELYLDRPFAAAKDDHLLPQPSTRLYQVAITSELGYKIISCRGAPVSESESSQQACRIAPGGSSAVFHVALTSGPTDNPYQAWWGGTVALHQIRK